MDPHTSRAATGPPKKPGKLLVILVISGLLLIGLVAGYIYLTYSPSVGTGPAGPPVSREIFGQTWTDRHVLLVGFGDSLTAGFGARRGYSFFDRLVKNPPDEFEGMNGICLPAVFPHFRATNLAVSGSVSAEVLGSQLARLRPANRAVLGWVVMTTGGNDLIHSYGKAPPRECAMYGASWEQAQPWIANYERRLADIIKEIQSRFPGGCHIFLANIYDPSDSAGDIDKAGLPRWPDGLRILAAYNEVIRQVADKYPYVHVVNMHDAFLGHGIHSAQFWARHYDRHDPHYWFYTNLEDPNERGYDAIRRLFLNEMASVASRVER